MKKLFIVTALLLAFAGQHAFAQAVIKFEKTTINLGTFHENEQQHPVFEFTNTGDKPLVIEQVITSCGCTKTAYPEEPIAPGKTGKIVVTYDGKGKYGGEFKKAISIRSNATNKLVRIYFEGSMIKDKQ